ncbi:MAG: hypothetical protein EZS28_031413 [Streblomastix strix]|uniref:Uncharacterized protein n=1 Tax=Streblomastix strix TaxID=222440 RepID=A0A5J4USF1_9EUKA|nr:MAG: hypothetical protein EZS28_031413 [Streblomastix strix]
MSNQAQLSERSYASTVTSSMDMNQPSSPKIQYSHTEPFNQHVEHAFDVKGQHPHSRIKIYSQLSNISEEEMNSPVLDNSQTLHIPVAKKQSQVQIDYHLNIPEQDQQALSDGTITPARSTFSPMFDKQSIQPKKLDQNKLLQQQQNHPQSTITQISTSSNQESKMNQPDIKNIQSTQAINSSNTNTEQQNKNQKFQPPKLKRLSTFSMPSQYEKQKQEQLSAEQQGKDNNQLIDFELRIGKKLSPISSPSEKKKLIIPENVKNQLLMQFMLNQQDLSSDSGQYVESEDEVTHQRGSSKKSKKFQINKSKLQQLPPKDEEGAKEKHKKKHSIERIKDQADSKDSTDEDYYKRRSEEKLSDQEGKSDSLKQSPRIVKKKKKGTKKKRHKIIQDQKLDDKEENNENKNNEISIEESPQNNAVVSITPEKQQKPSNLRVRVPHHFMNANSRTAQESPVSGSVSDGDKDNQDSKEEDFDERNRRSHTLKRHQRRQRADEIVKKEQAAGRRWKEDEMVENEADYNKDMEDNIALGLESSQDNFRSNDEQDKVLRQPIHNQQENSTLHRKTQHNQSHSKILHKVNSEEKTKTPEKQQNRNKLNDQIDRSSSRSDMQSVENIGTTKEDQK